MQKIIQETKLDFDDVLILPRPSSIDSRADIQLEIASGYFQTDIVPLAASSVDGVGTISMARTLVEYKMPVFLNKSLIPKLPQVYTKSTAANKYSDVNHQYLIPTFGIGETELKIFEELLDKFGDYIHVVNIDVANGYTEKYRKVLTNLCKKHPVISFIAGDVCDAVGTKNLFDCGASMVKCGIGPGSFCLTRKQTGIGNPQISTLLECKEVAERYIGEIICDGGCQSAGDVAKAFAAGSYLVICAGLFSGYQESECFKDSNTALFYGMSSNEAMKKYDNLKDYRTYEGRIVELKNKGSVRHQVQNILGGLRSACAYTDCKNVHELYEKTQFVKVNHQYNKMFENA